MGEIVHDIDGHAERFRAGRHRNAGLAGAGAEHGNDAIKTGRERITAGALDFGSLRRFQRAHIMRARQRIPTHHSAGGRKHPELRLRELSGTDQKDRSGLQVEKHRQESHVTLASPIAG
jgi:hypothetical protein